MYKDRTKEDRAAWLKQTLRERGIPEHGMRKEIIKRLGVSAGTVDRILQGQDPKATIGGRLSHQFDFLLSDYLWENFVIEEALGPNRKKRIAEETKNLYQANTDATTEKTLRTLLKFISDNYLPNDWKASDKEWQDNVVEAFFIFHKTLKAGLSPEAVLEMGTAIAEFENPMGAAGGVQ
jgi:hypothetical protein